MTERKYTLEELFGYTNGESNYWKIHENDDGHTRSLVTVKGFNSWEDKNFLWFDMLDRGTLFYIPKDDMDLFFAHFGQTIESTQFNSWLDKDYWSINFLSPRSGFVLTLNNDEMDSFWEKINNTVEISSYEEYVTHTKNSDEVDKVMQQRKESE